MTTQTPYETSQPLRSAIDEVRGPQIIEFGTDWCGFCRSAQSLIAAALSSHAPVAHRKVEDGKGRPLGRSFGVKLWPTLVFLHDGQEVGRLVRPGSAKEISAALAVLLENRQA